jgi:hypothetical protein
MTKTYAAKKLFEHGPLTLAEFREITGWKEDICWWVLGQLRSNRVLLLVRRGGGEHSSLYELA